MLLSLLIRQQKLIDTCLKVVPYICHHGCIGCLPHVKGFGLVGLGGGLDYGDRVEGLFLGEVGGVEVEDELLVSHHVITFKVLVE
jgi:hypothetical protein